MEPVRPAPGAQVPPLPFNVRVDFLDANGVLEGMQYARLKYYHTFGNLIGRVCRYKGYDYNQYHWCSGTVTLYKYDNGRRVQHCTPSLSAGSRELLCS